MIYNSIEDSIILCEPVLSDKHTPTFISISTDVDDKRKNIYKLIGAFSPVKKNYPESRLILVGHCRKDQGVYLKAKQNNLLSGVEFKGMLSRQELMTCIDESTCLVHPAVEETFGNTLIEGMARCIPVIGGDHSGAVPYVLDEGNCGILCDISSAQSLSKAMLKTIEEKSDINNMVKRAREKLKTSFSNTVVCNKHIQMYEKFL